MTVFDSVTEIKELKLFSRLSSTPITINIVNESTNVKTVIDLTTDVNYAYNTVSYYDVLTFTAPTNLFINDNFYFINVLDVDNKVLFRDKIFCTNQDVTDNSIYTINNNRYKENVTTNEYTIYE